MIFFSKNFSRVEMQFFRFVPCVSLGLLALNDFLLALILLRGIFG